MLHNNYGRYIFDLGPDENSAMDTLNFLKDHNFIDVSTRVRRRASSPALRGAARRTLAGTRTECEAPSRVQSRLTCGKRR